MNNPSYLAITWTFSTKAVCEVLTSTIYVPVE